MAARTVRNIVVISNITISHTEITRNRNIFQSHCIYRIAACYIFHKPLSQKMRFRKRAIFPHVAYRSENPLSTHKVCALYFPLYQEQFTFNYTFVVLIFHVVPTTAVTFTISWYVWFIRNGPKCQY